MPLRERQPHDVVEAAELLESTLRPRSGEGLWAENRASMDRFMRQPRLIAEKAWLAVFDGSGNPTQLRLSEYARVKNPIALARQTSQARRLMSRVSVNVADLRDEPFVLVPLQVQPEASVDVLAWSARDQSKTVESVSAAVGGARKVIVKEHSHQFGSRPIEFYERLSSLPNVAWADPFSLSQPWAECADAVITATGTMSLENALAGRRSYVMAPTYFDGLRGVQYMEPSRIRSSLKRDLDLPASEGLSPLDYLAQMLRSSTPGVVSNPRTTPSVLDPGNIADLANGYLAVLRSLHLNH